jgi:hypothetical protein
MASAFPCLLAGPTSPEDLFHWQATIMGYARLLAPSAALLELHVLCVSSMLNLLCAQAARQPLCRRRVHGEDTLSARLPL